MSRYLSSTAVIACTVGILLVLLSRIAYRHYQSVALDFESAPPAEVLLHPDKLQLPAIEEMSVTLEFGALSGWYVPSRNRAAVIIVHGTNGDRSSMLPEIRALANAGFGVLAFDWPGCGLSAGKVHWGAQARQALEAALNWLESRRDVEPGKIGGFGFSMGSYVMAQVSVDDKRLGALILAGTPTGYQDLIEWQNRKWGILSEFPARWALRHYGLFNNELRPLDTIAKVAPRPVLLVAGDKDDEVPAFMAQKLFDAAGSPKFLYIVSGAEHGKYDHAGGNAYRSRVVDFFTTELLAK